MYRRMGKLTSLICCLCILSQMTGCAGSSPSMVTKNGIYFDTAITITLAADNARAGEEILNGCMELCQKLEGIFSRTLEGSELYQVNHRDSSTVTVSKELAAVIGCGLEYYRLSEGKLDITIAPVLELWDFKNAGRTGRGPETGRRLCRASVRKPGGFSPPGYRNRSGSFGKGICGG